MPTALAFSNDGKLLAASSVGLDQKQTTYLYIQTLVWTVNTGEKLFTVEGHKVDVPALIFSKDDRFLLTGSVDTTIKFWDMKTGLLSKTFSIPSHIETLQGAGGERPGALDPLSLIGWTTRTYAKENLTF